MENVLKIIKEIASTSSRNEKESIIQRHKDNTLLKDILNFVFDPYTVTGLSTKKTKKNVRETVMGNINNIYELIDYLKEHNTGTDKDIAEVQLFISKQPQELQELYTQIVTKSLKIGVTAKTLNKIYGKEFIKEFNVMLAERYFDNEDKVTGEFIVTTKLDGGRIVLIKENGSIKFFSRQGQIINDLIEIYEDAKLLPDNMVYDGELLLRNDKNLDSKDLYRATMKEMRKDGIKKNLAFNCFDILPIEDFKNGICKTYCKDRKQQLHKILSNLNLKHIIEVPVLYCGTDKNQIIRLLDEARARNEEGVMVNLCNDKSYYECKRTKNLLKVKVMQTIDVKCIGFEEGSGANSHTLGAIIFEYKNNITKCGSGFALKSTELIPVENTRDYIWNNQDKFLNKIFELQFFEETTNQQGGISVRFPVFLHWRFNKTEPSYN